MFKVTSFTQQVLDNIIRRKPYPSAIITDDHFPPRAVHPPLGSGQITACSSAALSPGALTVSIPANKTIWQSKFFVKRFTSLTLDAIESCELWAVGRLQGSSHSHWHWHPSQPALTVAQPGKGDRFSDLKTMHKVLFSHLFSLLDSVTWIGSFISVGWVRNWINIDFCLHACWYWLSW